MYYMLDKMPLDVILVIFMNFNTVNDLISIIKLNTYFNYNIDDTYFIIWGINHYSKDFWIKASKRSKNISKPLNLMKLELLRIQRFIDYMKIQNISWTNQDFYNFWNMLEEYKLNKNKTTKNYFYTNLSIPL